MIYFIRHGQTDDNINGNLSGHSNTPLNLTGVEQAKSLANRLKDIHFEICYCSTLNRAKQTLNEIKKYHKGLKIIFDDRLKERDYGEITGKPNSICNFRRWNANDKISLKMESIPEMFQRISNFYDEVLPTIKGKNVMIVSHSGVGRMSHFYFYGKPKDNDYSSFKLENTELIKFKN